MVLPVSSTRVKNTAAMIAVTIMPTSANCLTNAWLNACSVWVLVSWSEFSLIASIARATCVAWFGSASLTMYQPTRLLTKSLASSKYFQLNTSWFSSPRRFWSLTLKIAATLNVQVLPPLVGKIVACSGTVSPIFQPYFLASDSPTAMPSRVDSNACTCSSVIEYSGYRSKKPGPTAKFGKKSLGSR